MRNSFLRTYLVAMNNNRLPRCPWALNEIAALYAALLLVVIVGSVANNYQYSDLLTLIVYVLSIYVPIYWTRKKYHKGAKEIGIRKGHLSMMFLLLSGIAMTIIYIIVSTFYLATPSEKIEVSYIYILLYPISVHGFITLILGPIGEEISHRGLLYGYLRNTRLGVVWGLVVQALLFSMIHFRIHDIIANLDLFVIGIILGILYELTGSLYPSIICHGLINYISLIRLVK